MLRVKHNLVTSYPPYLHAPKPCKLLDLGEHATPNVRQATHSQRSESATNMDVLVSVRRDTWYCGKATVGEKEMRPAVQTQVFVVLLMQRLNFSIFHAGHLCRLTHGQHTVSSPYATPHPVGLVGEQPGRSGFIFYVLLNFFIVISLLPKGSVTLSLSRHGYGGTISIFVCQDF